MHYGICISYVNVYLWEAECIDCLNFDLVSP